MWHPDHDEPVGETVGLTRDELLRRAGAAGALLAGGALVGGAAPAAAGLFQSPRRGGNFRFGCSGGSVQDIIDGQRANKKTDAARLITGFDSLAYYDEKLKIRLGLAEEITPDKSAKVWTIRVQDGIEFHNGKTLSADDVAYSFRRILKKDLGLSGYGQLASVDPNGIRKLDKRTVRLTLKGPDVTMFDSFAQYFIGMVPEGYSPNTFSGGRYQFIGTGPFKVQKFTPGRESVHVRNPNYWRSGRPYLDQVRILDINDDTARLNALTSGQVDAILDLPFNQVPLIRRRAGLEVYEAPSGNWIAFCMNVNEAPFNDVRVRRALKYLANRPQMIAQALAGHGVVANDVFSPYDPFYIGNKIKKYTYDPERAKSLLKAAGHDSLTLELATAAADGGMVESAQVLAQNAKAGGVDIKVNVMDSGTLFGDNWGKWPFFMDYWGTRNYLPQASQTNVPESGNNVTHFNHTRYNQLFRQARRTLDPSRRRKMLEEMQRIDHEDGALLIWGFKNWVDAYATKVKGLKVDNGSQPFNTYGRGFSSIWLA